MQTFLGIQRHRSCLLRAIVIGALLQPVAYLRAQQSPPEPVYVRIDSGWLGLFGHGDEYARFPIAGRDVQLQDPNHVLVRQGLGLMISFVDKTDLAGPDPLIAHARWEADYWPEHAARVDTATRLDLADGRHDVRVTELTLWNGSGDRSGIYLIGLRAADGVFAFGFSPADPGANAVVRRFVRSLQVVHRPLTPDELARISGSTRK